MKRKDLIKTFAFVILVGALLVIPSVYAAFYSGYEEQSLVFGSDVIGPYAYLSYEVEPQIINWLNNQQDVIQVENTTDYTQIWYDPNWKGGKAVHMLINFNDQKMMKELLTYDLPGVCGGDIYLPDKSTGEIYRVYIEDGQLQRQIDDGVGCLG